ncbi:MAG TPA: cupin domain-containing protein [Chloroflexota bacterium]|nr:cupin domain-containing protein [Chloroflexota bacterium]
METQSVVRRIVWRLGAAAAAALAFGLLLAPGAQAQEALVISTLTEKRVAQLPAGPLFWRVETYPTLAAAQAAAGTYGLAAESAGRNWLLTLGPRGGASPGGTRVAEIGPLPPVQAPEYLLRINQPSGPRGSETPVHTHPGTEAFYVVTGELSIRSAAGVLRIPAGGTSAGPAGGTPLQVSSTGAANLSGLVLFVVDATQPFSSPATLPTLPTGLPRTGGAGVPPVNRGAVGTGGALLALGLAGAFAVRARSARRLPA